MATHSRVLAWRIPGTAEPGGQSRTRLKWLSSNSSIRRGLEAECLGKHQMMELLCREEASNMSIIQKGILFTSLIPSSLDDTCFTGLML